MEMIIDSSSPLKISLWGYTLEKFGIQTTLCNNNNVEHQECTVFFVDPVVDNIGVDKCIQKFPTQKIVCFVEDSFVNKIFFPSQVVGLISKDSSLEEIITCLKYTKNGRKYVSPNLILEHNTVQRSVIKELSSREAEILKLYADRLTTKAIASKLFISHFTVQNHSKAIQKKLNLSGRNCIIRHSELLRAKGVL